MLAMIIGSTVGGYLPTIFGAGVFSLASIICGGVGGIFGIWLSAKFLD